MLCFPCPGLPRWDVVLVRVYPVALFFLSRFTLLLLLFPCPGLPHCVFSLSGSSPLRCFPCFGLPHCSVFSCPGLPRRCSVFLVRVYPIAMLSLSGSTPLLCDSCPGLPRHCSVFLVRDFPVALFSLSGPCLLLMHADSLLHGANKNRCAPLQKKCRSHRAFGLLLKL